ncbi:hypothetical protein JCM24511_02087 [Saitozyma sp. JCM 24511]|nr:hypothetical protein JCM24511_02087 [Saitozyma sp. JCM 24511]
MCALRSSTRRLPAGLCSPHRLSTTAAPSEIAAWIEELTSRAPRVAEDVVDPQRALHLQRTLPTRVGSTAISLPSAGLSDSLPKGHHLVLFQPQTTLDALGGDGSSTLTQKDYNAPSPYLRRMWAGGSFQWNPEISLPIGAKVSELTRVPKVEFKNNMIFVHQEKTVIPEGSKDWALREMRTHVFRTDANVRAPEKGGGGKYLNSRLFAFCSLRTEKPPSGLAIPNPTHSFTYTPSSPLLFRYSALTYNGHKIHYDRDWVKNVEGHPDLVVHGPLTSTVLTELAALIAQQRGKTLEKFEYRATSPMYVDREIKMSAGEEMDGNVELMAQQSGTVGMKATATLV